MLIVAIPNAHAGDSAAGAFQPASFKIMSADGSQVLGHGEYHLENRAAQPTLVGQNRYVDGGYDIERDVVNLSGDSVSLVSYQHSFFNADGSQKQVESADLRNGEAKCISFDNGDVQAAIRQIDFPADTYAGATAVLAMENALRQNGGQASFHVFDCGPTPDVIAVAAQPTGEQLDWGPYPGKLTQMDVTADLGWLGSVVGGLIPHRLAWFDPTAGWRFVGGKIRRYFNSGQEVMLVREVARPAASAVN